MHDSPSSKSTSTSSTFQKTFDGASDSSESLSKFKSFAAITLTCSVCPLLDHCSLSVVGFNPTWVIIFSVARNYNAAISSN